ncbi:hypothetical protein DQK91_22760, partial [Oceanidesulfovibrio marinus]
GLEGAGPIPIASHTPQQAREGEKRPFGCARFRSATRGLGPQASQRLSVLEKTVTVSHLPCTLVAFRPRPQNMPAGNNCDTKFLRYNGRIRQVSM